MPRVIETNLSMANGVIVDFQSRAIDVLSWNSYVNEIGNGDSVSRSAIIGEMHGDSLPKGVKIENFTYNKHTLSCDFYNYCDIHSKKLAYLVDNKNERIEFENGSIIEFTSLAADYVRGVQANKIQFQREFESKFIEEVKDENH